MKSLQELYRIAQQNKVVVDDFRLRKREALSVMDSDGACFIAIDTAQIKSESDERNKLAHELGHCLTGSFYNEYSRFDCRQRYENTADKWAISQIIPVEELDEAIASGYTELWELAERFDVPEEFIRKAVCLYVYGNVATDMYF